MRCRDFRQPLRLRCAGRICLRYFNHTLPVILGTDISGVVSEVGAGVTAFKPGDAVYARGGVSRDGAYAEYAVVPETDAARANRSRWTIFMPRRCRM